MRIDLLDSFPCSTIQAYGIFIAITFFIQFIGAKFPVQVRSTPRT